MPSSYFEPRDARNARLHQAILSIERELARLPDGTPDTVSGGLRDAWSAFVTLLAVEPPHELRECPSCKSFGMRAAIRCGNCWTKLAPLAPLPAIGAPGEGAPDGRTIVRGVD